MQPSCNYEARDLSLFKRTNHLRLWTVTNNEVPDAMRHSKEFPKTFRQRTKPNVIRVTLLPTANTTTPLGRVTPVLPPVQLWRRVICNCKNKASCDRLELWCYSADARRRRRAAPLYYELQHHWRRSYNVCRGVMQQNTRVAWFIQTKLMYCSHLKYWFPNTRRKTKLYHSYTFMSSRN